MVLSSVSNLLCIQKSSLHHPLIESNPHDRVLWNQLIQWMVYGKVFDPMDEFFIVEQLKIDETTDDPEVEKDSQCRRIQFQLKMERIPTLYFSTNLAEKVYFIGQTMSIFQRQTRELVSNNNPYVSEFLPTCERLKLEPEFDLLTVETEVEGMRKSVARGFWTIVVDEGQLRAHLRALKDYFLLSNGTLYQEFIETSRVLMSSVATERAVKDLYRGPFLQSARNCLDLDQDPYFQRLELHVPIQNFTWTCPTSKKVASSLRSSSSSTFEVSGILDGIYSKDNLNNSMGTMSCMEPKQVSTGFQSILNFSIPNSDNSNRDWSIIFCFDTQSRVSNIRRAREDDDDSPGIVSTASSCVMVEVSAKGIRSSSYCVDTHTWTVEEAWVQSNNLQKLFSQHDRDSHTLIVEYKHKILKVIDDRRNVVFQWKITKPPLINLFHQCQYLRIIALDDRLDNQAQRHHIQVNQWSFSKPYEKPEESWQSLSLRYTSPWPVHTIITPESIESYNRMFRFLFRLKQINQDIEHGWSILGRSHRESSPAVGEILSHPIWYRSMCILRSKMNFLIQHLQFYIQVHVIEVQFQELMATIEASSITRDFESIRLVHQRYLATCVSKCFLNVETIQRAFAQVLSSCGAFGKWLISTVGKGTETSETQVAQLETFEREFHDTSKYLFLVLQHSDAHDLVLQLDFNCYWTEQVHLEMD